MKTVYTPKHKNHAPEKGFSLGKIIDCFEKPSRAEYVLEAVKHRNLGPVIEPDSFSHDKILSIHNAGYVEFLKTAYQEWAAEGFEGNAMGSVFNQHPNASPPKHIDAKLGYYFADTIVSLTPTSWSAIEASAFTALTGQSLISQGEKSAFALCRPPGHHASASVSAGYCFLNNAAIAAQGFIDSGAQRVAVLDVDYHHGNGTQEILYSRQDVLFASIHADPDAEYPYFLGHADEKGQGQGEGYNFNYPLPHGTNWDTYASALQGSLKQIRAYGPDALVISLGVDTFKDDPISQFCLESDHFLKMGQLIGRLNLPTLFVMEGGYDVEAIGLNVANVLSGFSDT